MMNKTYLKKLEYYQILEQISNYCHTYIGKEKVLNLEPSNDKEKIVQVASHVMQVYISNNNKKRKRWVIGAIHS